MTCSKCGNYSNKLSWLRERDGWCPSCFHASDSTNKSAMINTDDIPGGIDIKHGICNDDGSPKRYYSKSEIKRAAYDKGLFIMGETPKPNPRMVEERTKRYESNK